MIDLKTSNQRLSKCELLTAIAFSCFLFWFTTMTLMNFRFIPSLLCSLKIESTKSSKVLVMSNFEDLLEIVKIPAVSNQTVKNVIVTEYISNEIPKRLGDFFNIPLKFARNSLIKFHLDINEHHLYKHEADPVLRNLLNDLATMPIVRVEEMGDTTHLTLIVHFENGLKAIFKPTRFPRHQQTDKNHLYLSDYERANAEIAAFHLDRLLGFGRVLPSIGRKINLSEMRSVSSEIVRKSFFQSPINNTCFHGRLCDLYCDDDHAICADDDNMVEGVFTTFLPDNQYGWNVTVHDYPWRRTGDPFQKAKWEFLNNNEYCHAVVTSISDKPGKRILDFMDMAVFDFLMGNLNRRYYYTFGIFEPNSHIIHVNNARGFGKPYEDDLSILAPLLQCCKIRRSTLQKLLNYYRGPIKLSAALEKSMAHDLMAPILWRPHLIAIDRRIKKILREIQKCLLKDGVGEILKL